MLTLHNKDFKTRYGAINSVIEAFVEEERNGLFELSFVMLNTDSLFKYIEEDNIVVANANNTLVNQKFRIYKTRKLMNNRVEVFARHISFDLMYDYIDNISFENQSCEYALNSLFRNSNFSKHYKGYSDIINAQNYSMSMANVLEAIGGKEGSLIDTFGTGAELLRDNENIHILSKRGYDNSVSIEYRKNLTGFELEEDATELITRILPYARYTPKDSEGNLLEETTIKASFVDSPLLANYSHPFIKFIDYTDKFKEGEEVTTSKLITFAQNEYRDNKVDIPRQNFKIEFIPLSKCVGYEGLEDNIGLCDTVTIKDTRYNIDTQAKVIKVVFNVLKNRYESMELGEPKTSLRDIIGNNNSTKGEKGDKGDKGDKGEDGSIGDFPNTLPATPIVNAKVYGFANIEISWTFENKVYYQYEVYASKEADFTPNAFNLIHSGQTSTYMYQAKPNETWYFKVCAINTHGDRTNFGNAYATTAKVDDLSNYVEEMAIDEALIGTLSLDRGWVGTLKGNHIDAKNLSVTNGNGKRTLDIDSYGNVSLDVASLKISSSNVATENYADTKATQVLNDSKTYTTTQITATNNKVASIETNLDSITQRVSSTESTTSTLSNKVDNLQVGGTNLWVLSDLQAGYESSGTILDSTACHQTRKTIIDISDCTSLVYQVWNPNKVVNSSNTNRIGFFDSSKTYIRSEQIPKLNGATHQTATITKPTNAMYARLGAITGASSQDTDIKIKFEKGNKPTDWTPAPEDVQGNIDTLQSTITTTNNKVAEITTNLDSITQRVSSTETTTSALNGAVDKLNRGLNKWLFEIFDRGNITGTGAITASDLLNKTPRKTLLIDEMRTGTQAYGEYFLARLTTHVYLDSAYSWTVNAASDDEGTLYLNGKVIATTTTTARSVTLPFTEGWNKITWVFNENAGHEGAWFSTALSSLPQIKIINAYPQTNIDEEKLALNSNVSSLTTRIQTAESKITDTAITNTVSKTFYTKDDINNKGYQTSSQVKQEVDNLQIKFTESGGYNLFLNSSFKNDLSYWGISGDIIDGNISILDSNGHFAFKDDNVNTIQVFMQNKSNKEFGIKQDVNLVVGKVYSIDFFANGSDCGWGSLILENNGKVEHVLHFDPLEYGGGFNKWMDVDFSFTATTENYTIKIVLKDAGNSGHMWIAKPNLVEGIKKVWTPNPNELYGNTILIDKDGLKINHSDNSKGVYDAKGITYYNSQGIKTSAISDGRFSTIDNEGNVIGYTGKSVWKGTDTYLTSLEASYGSTVGMGAIISGNGDAVIPLVVASQGMLIGDTWMQQGLNIFSPRTFEKQTFFRKNIGIESVTMEQYADDLDYGVIVGSNGINMGVIHDNQSSISFCIEKNLNYYTKCIVQCHTDLNMNNFSILNANIKYSLVDASSDVDNGIKFDEEEQVATIDIAKTIFRLNQENETLKLRLSKLEQAILDLKGKL